MNQVKSRGENMLHRLQLLFCIIVLNGCSNFSVVELRTEGEPYQELKHVVDYRMSPSAKEQLQALDTSFDILKYSLETAIFNDYGTFSVDKWTLGDAKFSPSPVLTFDMKLNSIYGNDIPPLSVYLFAFKVRVTPIAGFNKEADCSILANYKQTTFTINHQDYFWPEHYERNMRNMIDGCINDAINKIKEIHDSH
jgi:hypothetical protein